MFSGIMITYDVPGFPLYYIDERMLSLLNYSNQADLIAATGQDMINCIRSEGPGGPAGRDCTGPSQWDQLYNDL